MTSSFTEGPRHGGFVLSTGNVNISFENVTIHGGYTGAGKLKAGTVLGKITSGGKYTISPNTGADGSQTAVAILYDNIDVTDGDVVAAVVKRDAEVIGANLIYDSTVDDDTKKGTKNSQLAAAGIGIIVR